MAVAAAGPGEGWPGRLAKSHAVTLRWRTSTALAATLAARPAPRTAGSGSVAAYGNRQRRAPWGQQARGQPDLGQPDWGQPDCGQSGRAAGRPDGGLYAALDLRSEEHTSELQSLMRISYAVFCLKKKKN